MPPASDSPRTSRVTRAANFGQVQGRLPCGVRPTYDVDFLAGHRLRLDARRAVENTCPDKTFEGWDADSTVGYACSNDHRPGSRLAPVGESDHTIFATRS